MHRLTNADIMQALTAAMANARAHFAVTHGVPESDVEIQFAWPDRMRVTITVPIRVDVVEDEAEPIVPG